MTNKIFVETKQYRRFEEFCDNCAKYKYMEFVTEILV